MSKPPKGDTEVAVAEHAGPPAELMEDMVQYSGAGVSERTADFAFPFLAIAQANSPQLKRQQEDKYIPGLEAGDVFNTATRKHWRTSAGEAIRVVPVWFQKAMVEWILRDQGGGYVATHDIDVEMGQRMGGPKKRFLLTPDGHQLVDTSYHFVLDEDGSAVVVPMTSTGLACSRMWQTLMKDVKVRGPAGLVIAPCFARVYDLRTVYKKNDQGDWHTWSVSDAGWCPQHLYHLAKQNYLNFQENGVVLGRPPVDEADLHAPVGTEPPI